MVSNRWEYELMKKTAIILAILFCATAYAAVELLITIPTEYVVRIVPAIVAGQDAHISVHIQGSQGAGDPNATDYTLDFDFRSDRDPNDTTKQYAEKVLRRFTLAWARAHEKKLNIAANQLVIEALPPTDSNLPDDTIQ